MRCTKWPLIGDSAVCVCDCISLCRSYCATYGPRLVTSVVRSSVCARALLIVCRLVDSYSYWFRYIADGYVHDTVRCLHLNSLLLNSTTIALMVQFQLGLELFSNHLQGRISTLITNKHVYCDNEWWHTLFINILVESNQMSTSYYSSLVPLFEFPLIFLSATLSPL